MPQQAVSITVTNLLHTHLEHLKDPWRPHWAAITTDGDVATQIKAAQSAAIIGGLAGVIAPLSAEDFTIAFTSAEGEPLRVKADFVNVIVTRDSMRIELFDPRMQFDAQSDTQESAAFILIHYALTGLI